MIYLMCLYSVLVLSGERLRQMSLLDVCACLSLIFLVCCTAVSRCLVAHHLLCSIHLHLLALVFPRLALHIHTSVSLAFWLALSCTFC